MQETRIHRHWQIVTHYRNTDIVIAGPPEPNQAPTTPDFARPSAIFYDSRSTLPADTGPSATASDETAVHGGAWRAEEGQSAVVIRPGTLAALYGSTDDADLKKASRDWSVGPLRGSSARISSRLRQASRVSSQHRLIWSSYVNFTLMVTRNPAITNQTHGIGWYTTRFLQRSNSRSSR